MPSKNFSLQIREQCGGIMACSVDFTKLQMFPLHDATMELGDSRGPRDPRTPQD